MDLALKKKKLEKAQSAPHTLVLRRVRGSINHLRQKRFNLRLVGGDSAHTSQGAREAGSRAAGAGRGPGLRAAPGPGAGHLC